MINEEKVQKVRDRLMKLYELLGDKYEIEYIDYAQPVKDFVVGFVRQMYGLTSFEIRLAWNSIKQQVINNAMSIDPTLRSNLKFELDVIEECLFNSNNKQAHKIYNGDSIVPYMKAHNILKGKIK